MQRLVFGPVVLQRNFLEGSNMKVGDKVKALDNCNGCCRKGDICEVISVERFPNIEVFYKSQFTMYKGEYELILVPKSENHCKSCGKYHADPLTTIVCCIDSKRVVSEKSLTERRTELDDWEWKDSSQSVDASARYNSGKTQVREVDPAFIIGLGEVLTASREKYDEGNWMKETKFSTPYESCMRHMMKFWSGEETDEETGKHHLLHAATNLMFLYYHTRSEEGIDDRLFKKATETKK